MRSTRRRHAATSTAITTRTGTATRTGNPSRTARDSVTKPPTTAGAMTDTQSRERERVRERVRVKSKSRRRRRRIGWVLAVIVGLGLLIGLATIPASAARAKLLEARDDVREARAALSDGDLQGAT